MFTLPFQSRVSSDMQQRSTDIQAARENILIIRLSAIGDVVMASGLISATRARFPNARLAWISEPAAAPIIQGHPGLDHVIVWPKERWKSLWREGHYSALYKEFKQFKCNLRQQRFTLVIDAQGLLKSGLIAWLTGAKRRVALDPREGCQMLSTEHVKTTPFADRRIGSEYRYLARHIGAGDDDFKLDVRTGPEAQASARAFIDESVGGRHFIALAPFTTRPQKHWLEDHWIQLIGMLQRLGHHCVILGGPSDKLKAEELSHRTGATNAAGRLRLDASMALIARSTALIGVDTGLTHAGIALNRPTIAIFGSTWPYERSDSPTTRVLYAALACSPCRRNPTCGGRYDCMSAITPTAVVTHLQELVSA